MKTSKLIFPILVSFALVGACSSENSAKSIGNLQSDISENIESNMNKALDEVKTDMKDIDIDLKDGGKATIAENGDMTINGKAVTLNAEQRALSKGYFDTMKKIALQGVEIGKESAKIATQAIGMAVSGIFSGDGVNDAAIEKKVEAKAGDIKVVAMKLCDSADELRVIQEKLIKTVPGFNPEPIEVDRSNDGCNVNSNDNIYINTHVNSNDEDKALDATEAPAPTSK